MMKSTSLTSRPASATNPLRRGHLHEITWRTKLNIAWQIAVVSSEAPQRISPDIAGVQTNRIAPTLPQSKAMALNLTDLRGSLLHIQSMGQTWLQKIMAQESKIKQQDRALTESHERVQRAGHELTDLKARLQASELRLVEERQASEILFTLTEKQAQALSSLREEVSEVKASAAAKTAAAVAVLSRAQPPSAALKPVIAQPCLDQVTLIYTTNTWGAVHVHHKADSKPWSQSPGLAMECTRGKEFQVRFPGCIRLEFVLTDGHGGWDKPSSGQNYVIEAAGVYSLENGRITCRP